MVKRFAPVLLVAGLAFAGCGGGGDSKPAPAAKVGNGGEVVATTTPSAAAQHSDSKRAKGKRDAGKSSTHSRGGSAAPNTQAGTGSDAGSPTRKQAAKKPPAVTCLEKAGLAGARTTQPGHQWVGMASGEPVIVDGPYKTAGAAAESARSLAGASIAESGGLWVASATIRSHLTKQVHRVALCMGNGVVTAQVQDDPNAATGQG